MLFRSKRHYAAEICEMVHQALRWWRFPTREDNLEDVLQSYAWEHGIVDAEARQKAVGRARVLLNWFRRSPLYAEIAAAQVVYRELPFLFRVGERTIRGVIDVLLQHPDGSWALVDYKTSYVPRADDPQVIVDHARRFHLQVGVYAAAIREQLGGVVPAVIIHYIRHTQTVHVSTAEWETALSRLEDQLGDILG